MPQLFKLVFIEKDPLDSKRKWDNRFPEETTPHGIADKLKLEKRRTIFQGQAEI